MHDDEVAISEQMVRGLIDNQFPAWRSFPLELVEPWGTDNAIWRLGTELVVRLPRIAWAVEQIEFEHRWLSRLARHIAQADVPEAVVVGVPAGDYPFPWAVHRWLPGATASPATIRDPVAFALDVARLVAELRLMPTDDGRPARNRARPPAAYDPRAREAIASAAHLIDAETATAIWVEALEVDEAETSTWVHGDLEFNCLTSSGRLSGVVDWGSACVGDPAVDVQVMWSALFTNRARSAFVEALEVDDATLARSRGAAIHQACAALPYYEGTYPLIVERSWRKLETLGVGRV